MIPGTQQASSLSGKGQKAFRSTKQQKQQQQQEVKCLTPYTQNEPARERESRAGHARRRG
jgi:hypothetical protein